MKSIVFDGNTWQAYEVLRQKDKKMHESLCRILKELQRGDDPTQGLGKPEPLRYQYSGYWSRRLSFKDRLIYRFDEGNIYIASIGGHYDAH
jgi:toxin YoeB